MKCRVTSSTSNFFVAYTCIKRTIAKIAVKSHHNRMYSKVAGLLMDGSLQWLADGAINPIPPQYRDWQKNDYDHPARHEETRDQESREAGTSGRKAAA